MKERNGRKRLEIDVFNKCFVSDSVDRAHEAPVGSLWTSTSVAVPSASVTFLSSHFAVVAASSGSCIAFLPALIDF